MPYILHSQKKKKKKYIYIYVCVCVFYNMEKIYKHIVVYQAIKQVTNIIHWASQVAQW